MKTIKSKQRKENEQVTQLFSPDLSFKKRKRTHRSQTLARSGHGTRQVHRRRLVDGTQVEVFGALQALAAVLFQKKTNMFHTFCLVGLFVCGTCAVSSGVLSRRVRTRRSRDDDDGFGTAKGATAVFSLTTRRRKRRSCSSSCSQCSRTTGPNEFKDPACNHWSTPVINRVLTRRPTVTRSTRWM